MRICGGDNVTLWELVRWGSRQASSGGVGLGLTRPAPRRAKADDLLRPFGLHLIWAPVPIGQGWKYREVTNMLSKE